LGIARRPFSVFLYMSVCSLYMCGGHCGQHELRAGMAVHLAVLTIEMNKRGLFDFPFDIVIMNIPQFSGFVQLADNEATT
jgi:hypothetical protein